MNDEMLKSAIEKKKAKALTITLSIDPETQEVEVVDNAAMPKMAPEDPAGPTPGVGEPDDDREAELESDLAPDAGETDDGDAEMGLLKSVVGRDEPSGNRPMGIREKAKMGMKKAIADKKK